MWMNTRSGKQVDLLVPRPEQIDICDIAGALSKICRYNGQCEPEFSVGQHSILLSHAVPPHLAFVALMHDAPEAYIGDKVSMMKEMSEMQDFLAIENRIWKVIAEKWHLPYILPKELKEADVRMCKTECMVIFDHKESQERMKNIEPYDIAMIKGALGWTSKFIEHLFIQRFYETYNFSRTEHETY